jgi:uncharacterized protein (UPF0332 family)
MSFDWQEFASFSDQLCRDSDYRSEASFRAAASRYYYAAHWATRLLLESTLGMTFGREKVHAKVLDKCTYHVSRDMNRVGVRLKRLMDRRLHADYETEPEFRKREADEAGFDYLGLIGSLSSYEKTLTPPTT